MLLSERSFRRTVAGCSRNSLVDPGAFTRSAFIALLYVTAVDTAGETHINLRNKT